MAKVVAKPSKQGRKQLTKKQKKRLENVIKAKNKKAKRKELLEKLNEVQADRNHLKLLVSTSSMQTKGLKRYNREKKLPAKPKLHDKKTETEEQEESDSPSQSDSDTSDDSDNHEDEGGESNGDNDVNDAKSQNVNESKTLSDEIEPAEVEYVATETVVEPKLVAKQSAINPVQQKPSGYETVNRTKAIQDARLKLPILAEEQVVMEAINENSIVVLCGETGSGKTTQVPQFLYEAGYARTKMIGVTEPRRVAAISMSQRVAEEMNLTSDEVSYQIRFEGNVRESTKIKFLTDGVLLKEIQKDFLLLKYSVIIIDEAHERSVYTDVLVGLLSRIVPLRHKRNNPLKLIIMSATLRVEDFTANTRLFKVTPPVIKVDSRQYPVTVHFNKRTPGDEYISEAYRKVCKIHRTLPEGGILVFVTGRQEVMTMCHKLSRTFPANKHSQTELTDEQFELEKINFKKRKRSKKTIANKKPTLPRINLDDFAEVPKNIDNKLNDEEMSDHDGDMDDDYEDFPLMCNISSDCQPLYVLPLFSLLSTARQSKVFQPPPKGTRLCVVATNVAETSLTIPNIKYVVDTGKVKTKLYDKLTGVSAFVVTWTSKAGANQRAGRAGRTGPGHCYRLYSSAVFNDEFELFTQPEICRKPVDDLVLQMKDMNIDRVVNFPFPSAPDSEALKAAEKRLCMLDALEEIPSNQGSKKQKQVEWNNRVTALGHTMAALPLAPCYAKMLALAGQHDLFPYVVCIVSALTVQELLLDAPLISENTENVVSSNQKRQWKERRMKWAGQGQSLLLGDVMVLLKAVGSAEYAGCTPAFCAKHGLRHKAVIEVRKLRTQLTNSLNLVMPDIDLCVDPKMEPPDDLKIRLLRQIILSGVPNHVARKVAESQLQDVEEKKKYKNAYDCVEVHDFVYIDVNSALHQSQPEWIVYQEMVETTKLYLRGITAVEPEWLPIFAPSSCTFSKPLENPKPRYDDVNDQIVCHMTSTFGPQCWPLPAVETKYPKSLDRFRWFAVFLLEGLVIPELKQFHEVLLIKPIVMVKSWSNLQPKTECFLKALISKSVDSKASLISAWESDDKYLLSAYCDWIPESVRDNLNKLWPPMHE